MNYPPVPDHLKHLPLRELHSIKISMAVHDLMRELGERSDLDNQDDA